MRLVVEAKQVVSHNTKVLINVARIRVKDTAPRYAPAVGYASGFFERAFHIVSNNINGKTNAPTTAIGMLISG